MVAKSLSAGLTALIIGAALAAASHATPCEPRHGAARSLSQDRAGAQLADLGLEARLDRASGVYAVGETLSLTVTTRAAARIEAFNVNAEGRSARIAPLDADTVLINEPGAVMRIPVEPGVSLRVSAPTGRNEIVVVATAASQSRSTEFDPDLVTGGRRQDRVLCFRIVD
ncbi:MAG: DUF4384 domain-containing protein [Oceanicaulis sp.]